MYQTQRSWWQCQFLMWFIVCMVKQTFLLIMYREEEQKSRLSEEPTTQHHVAREVKKCSSCTHRVLLVAISQGSLLPVAVYITCYSIAKGYFYYVFHTGRKERSYYIEIKQLSSAWAHLIRGDVILMWGAGITLTSCGLSNQQALLVTCTDVRAVHSATNWHVGWKPKSTGWDRAGAIKR